MKSIPQRVFNALTATADTTSDTYAVPPGVTRLSWQSSYAVAPGAVDLRLLGSIDGTNFLDIDASTDTAGEMRILNPSAYRFVKVRQASKTGGTAHTTVYVTAHQDN